MFDRPMMMKHEAEAFAKDIIANKGTRDTIPGWLSAQVIVGGDFDGYTIAEALMVEMLARLFHVPIYLGREPDVGNN